MCQLCAINVLISDIRWPQHFENQISDLNFLVNTAHDEWKQLDLKFLHQNAAPGLSTIPFQASDAQPNPTATSPFSPPTSPLTPSVMSLIPKQHLLLLRDLSTALDALNDSRAEWWASPAKREQRQQWASEGKNSKLVGLQKINNAIIKVVEGCKARLGTYVVWGLGMKEGIAGLEELEG